MTNKKVTNGFDSYVGKNLPTTNFSSKSVLRVTNPGQISYVYFTMPFPKGVTIQSAKLRLTQYTAHSGSTTVSVQRISSSWSQNKINYNNDPGVTGPVVAVTKGSTANGTVWEFDVTASIQQIANGAGWYGFRVTTNSASQLMFHAMQSGTVSAHPVLDITWSDAPDQPDNLQPAAGRAVGTSKPTFSFHYNDPSGQDGIQSVQVQVATTAALLNANTPDVWNPGAIASDYASVDSGANGMAALTAGTIYYWRVRVTDDTGLTSIWSTIESFVYQPIGSLTMKVDGGSSMLSQVPTISWTFTGQVQKAYQVYAVDDSTNEIIWTTGKITSTATAVTVPLGVIKSDDMTVTFSVYVYDNIVRQGLSGSPASVSTSLDTEVSYDSGTAAVDTLGATSDPVFPYMDLLWTDDVTADWYQLQRRKAGDTAWTYGSELIDPVEAHTATNFTFAYSDHGAGMYVDYEWRIVPIRAGKQAAGGPTTSGRVKRLSPILMTPDKTKVVSLANADRNRTTGDIQDVVPVLAGPPVLTTQYIGGDQGHVEGILADNFLAGYTGKQMFEWFKWMRKNPGIPLKLFIADESLDICAYNMQFDTLVDNEGLYYSVSFDWVSRA